MKNKTDESIVRRPNHRLPTYPYPRSEPEKRYCPYCGRRLENGVCPEGPHGIKMPPDIDGHSERDVD